MKEKTKKAYHKPELARVKLVPEEAVLGLCKTDSATGPNTLPTCTIAVEACQTATS